MFGSEWIEQDDSKMIGRNEYITIFFFLSLLCQ